ncbi:hypothetical protein [Gluconobacter cerinus]|uniref:hypothetical protein n=1 Tax=Gluconobacter cerinus TaxID=38307 RepID=UPI003AB3653F
MTDTNTKAINAPYFSGQWCDPSGYLTPLATTVLRALMNRTGNAPGISSTDNQRDAADAKAAAEKAEEDAMKAALLGIDAGSSAAISLREAQRALGLAQAALFEAQVLRGHALKSLETARDFAIISGTARGNAQAAQSPDESMIFSIMKP